MADGLLRAHATSCLLRVHPVPLHQAPDAGCLIGADIQQPVQQLERAHLARYEAAGGEIVEYLQRETPLTRGSAA